MAFGINYNNGITDFPQFVVNGINTSDELFEDNASGAANEIITDYAEFTTPDNEPKAIHQGIDFAAAEGDNVSPLVTGRVSKTGSNFIAIEDSSGTNWIYGNVSNSFGLDKGDLVTTAELPETVDTVSDLSNTNPGDFITDQMNKLIGVDDSTRLEDRLGEIATGEGGLSKTDNFLHLEVRPEPPSNNFLDFDQYEGEEKEIKLNTNNPIAELENTRNVETFSDSVFDESSFGTYTIQSSDNPSQAQSIGEITGNVYRNSESQPQVKDVSIELFSPEQVDPNAETWVISHGWRGNPSGKFQELADTISSKDKQVALIDWSEAAATGSNPITDPREGANWISDVAGFASEALTNIWEISPDQLNLIGHSLGAYVSSEIGKEVGGVNKLVALDPATTASTPPFNFTADVNDNIGGTQAPTDFSEAADFSRAFWGNLTENNGLGSKLRAQTANESFEVEFDGGLVNTNHGNIVYLYDRLISNNNLEINNKFSLEDDLTTTEFSSSPSGDGPVGQTGPLTSGDEGVFLETEVDEVRPTKLKFRSLFGDVETIQNSSVSVANTNEAPTANDDAGNGFVTDEDNALFTGNVLDNDNDPEDDFLEVNLDSSNTVGTVTEQGNGNFIYDPNDQFESLDVGETATDSFEYTISDPNGGQDTATVTIKIYGVNDAPTANDDAGNGFVTDEDNALFTGNVLDNDNDPEDDFLEVSLDSSNTVGTVTEQGNGNFIYNPNDEFESLDVGETATDGFEYTISDPNGGQDTGKVNVKIYGVNEAVTTEPVNPSELPSYIPSGSREASSYFSVQPDGWSSATPWGEAINTAQSEGYIEIRSWKMVCDVNGNPTTVVSDLQQVEAASFQTEPWYGSNENTPISIEETENGHLRMPVSQGEVTHWFKQTPRPQVENAQDCYVTAEVKMSPGVLVAVGADWWVDPTSDYAGQYVNNKIIGRSGWHESAGNWQTIQFGNEESGAGLSNDDDLVQSQTQAPASGTTSVSMTNQADHGNHDVVPELSENSYSLGSVADSQEVPESSPTATPFPAEGFDDQGLDIA